MKKNTVFIFTGVLALMTLASLVFMARTLYAARQSAAFDPAAMVSVSPAADAPPSDTAAERPPDGGLYVAGLHDGYITVFLGADGTKGIKEVTATPVSALPREEWARLAVGVPLRDEEALSLFLQDYGS